ncbi:hypothetical protein [Streptomyces sp. SID2888]|uniref:hypothetical protein n=1 Tax=Streptomyces sp. SID2888 TaxID=2690256 RepID=UPI001F19EB3C|nr:hypothetical protein [Streptomyces sp. SID2888]
MNDLPLDLPRLRTLETWLAMTLDRVRQQIADRAAGAGTTTGYRRATTRTRLDH